MLQTLTLTLPRKVGTTSEQRWSREESTGQRVFFLTFRARTKEVTLQQDLTGTSRETRLIAAVGDPRYVVKKPIVVTLERDDSCFLLRSEGSGVYGVGTTENAAVADFESMLLERFEILSESPEMLSCRLADQLRHLQSMIAPA